MALPPWSLSGGRDVLARGGSGRLPGCWPKLAAGVRAWPSDTRVAVARSVPVRFPIMIPLHLLPAALLLPRGTKHVSCPAFFLFLSLFGRVFSAAMSALGRIAEIGKYVPLARQIRSFGEDVPALRPTASQNAFNGPLSLVPWALGAARIPGRLAIYCYGTHDALWVVSCRSQVAAHVKQVLGG